MSWHPHDPHVVAEVLAAKLCPNPDLLTHLEHLGLHGQIAEGLTVLVALGRQAVEIARAGELGQLEGVLGRGAADDEGEVVGRAGGRADHTQFVVDKGAQPLRGQQSTGLLEEKALVGRAAAFGHEHELIGHALFGENLDLGREVGAGVLLLEHAQRGQLAVAEIGLPIGLGNAGRDRGLVVAFGPHLMPLLAHDDGGAGILAHRQDPTRGDVGVFEHVERDEAVVVRGFWVVEDAAQLG